MSQGMKTTYACACVQIYECTYTYIYVCVRGLLYSVAGRVSGQGCIHYKRIAVWESKNISTNCSERQTAVLQFRFCQLQHLVTCIACAVRNCIHGRGAGGIYDFHTKISVSWRQRCYDIRNRSRSCQIISLVPHFMGSRDSSVGIPTELSRPDGPGIESRWGGIFRAHSDRPWGPPSLLYKGYRVFPWGKAAGRGVEHPLPI